MITFTLDLEDHLGVYAPDGRWVKNSERILDFCASRGIRGTFFTVGRAVASPLLLKRIVAEGHELALHSYDHIALTREAPDSYPAKLAEAKKRFEDLTGAAVVGFRAPQFSLTPQSAWVLDVLKEQGFLYSSSIIAGRGMFHGYPGKPATPFVWDNGLYEFPVPLVRAGPLALPFLGGVYLRYLPLEWVRGFVVAKLRGCAGSSSQPRSLATPQPVLWTYLHPYDIDHEEGFVRLDDGTPLWANMLLMANREGFLEKIGALLKGGAAAPLRERLLFPSP